MLACIIFQQEEIGVKLKWATRGPLKQMNGKLKMIGDWLIEEQKKKGDAISTGLSWIAEHSGWV